MSERAQFYSVHFTIIIFASALGYWCLGITNSTTDMGIRTLSQIGVVVATIAVISASIILIKEMAK